MAENDNDQDRTEQATQKRRDEAREKGQVARSQEVVSVSVLVAGLTFFYFGGANLAGSVMALMTTGFRDAGRLELLPETVNAIIAGYIFKGFAILFPLLLGVFVAAVLGNVLQFGFMISTESITPKISKISPAKGFKRLFSLRSMVEFVKNILKVCIIATVAYLVISSEIGRMMPLADQSIWEILSYIGGVCFKLLLSVTVVLVVLAALDYAYQRYEYEKSLKMTKQEIKDEYKSTEGDPMIKARIRRIQREAAQKRMMAQVPKADVVITNPTHLAVAISYDPTGMAAPVVVAKGADFIADKIRKIAEENEVPIVENKPLAQVLYKIVKVNAMVPESVYRAVAEVLAFVYEQKKTKIFG
ncbi:MAG: flagellar biosynthesis protein FlhB [Smithellaceae bacterium]